MFYSESLLSKTAPLHRVWLSANLERKLSKTHILQSSVKDSVEAIVDPDQAPMALRLSGQLLLGVVRIYSRKARYLLDDCNEALMKIKLAFRLSGNNDLPAGLHVTRDTLMMPDAVAEGDDLENLAMPPMPDASFFLAQLEDENVSLNRKNRAGSRDINLQEDYGSSQFLQNSIDPKNREEELGLDEEMDLDLDLGDDIIETGRGGDRSMEMGRDAPADRPVEDDIFSEIGINVPANDKDTILGDDRSESGRASMANDDAALHIVDEDGDIGMGGDDFQFGIGDAPNVSMLDAPAPDPRARISESPLSNIDENRVAEIDAEVPQNQESLNFEPEEEEETETIVLQPAIRARHRKAIPTDNETQISHQVIKNQQNDRSKILQPQTFLPRDPNLLALMEMQRNGSFVSSVLGSARDMAWAPELRGMLSLDAVRRTGELKRKRDSGVADMSGDEHINKTPRLEIAEEEDDVFAAGGDALLEGDETVVPQDSTIRSLAGSEGLAPLPLEDEEQPQIQPDEEDEGFGAGSPDVNFDDATAPLVHPADSGPVSLGTKHAVHLLRDRFGPEAADSPNKRKQASVLFQDLLPEATTSKADATKMFFEVLVLATKDAVKVEQKEGELGAAIRVRGKRGLWGDWAEREAGGEIEVHSQEMAGSNPVEAY